ncbi:MAG: EAL domain-containing protein [Actinomycetota bacterium]|nr:EAL domain-containing protein [Actinomycetota bacterium]
MDGYGAQSSKGSDIGSRASEAYIQLRDRLAQLIEESIANEVVDPLAENEAVAKILNGLPDSTRRSATSELIRYFKDLVLDPSPALNNLEKFAKVHFFCGIEDAWVDQIFTSFLYRTHELLIDFRETPECEVLIRDLTEQVIKSMKRHNEITSDLMSETLAKFQMVIDVEDEQPNFNEYIDEIRAKFLQIEGIDLCIFVSLLEVYPVEHETSPRRKVVIEHLEALGDHDNIHLSDLYDQSGNDLLGSIAVVPLNTIDHGPVTLILTSPFVGFFGRVIEEVHIRSFASTFERKNDRRIAILTLEQERKRAKIADRSLQILQELIELASITGPIEDHFKGLSKSILKIANISSVFILAIGDAEGEVEVLASAGLGMKSIKQLFKRQYSDDLYAMIKAGQIRVVDDIPEGALSEIFGSVASQFRWQSVIATPFVATNANSVMLFAASSDSTATSATIAALLESVNSIFEALNWSNQLEAKVSQLQLKLDRVDHFNPVTQLPNRTRLEGYIADRIAASILIEDFEMTITIIDLDNFKVINDAFGRGTGDMVLSKIGERLSTLSSDTIFVAHIGGDEFVVVEEGAKSHHQRDRSLDAMRLLISDPIDLGEDEEIAITATMGVTIYPADQSDPGVLLRHADTALFRAKVERESYGIFYLIYSDHWLSHFKAAETDGSNFAELLKSELEVYYQPVVDLVDKKIVRLEALARLRRDGRLLAPESFIPQLTHHQLTHLSMLVCEAALGDLAGWRREGIAGADELVVSINVVPQNFIDPRFKIEIIETLENYGIEASYLNLEVLETGEFLSLSQARNTISELRALGLQISLDDLGSAYAGLLRLREIIVDEVKLDRTFVLNLLEEPSDLHFIRSVKTLSEGLGIDLVVEGVADGAMLHALSFLGIRYAQGYYFSEPVSSLEAGDLLSNFDFDKIASTSGEASYLARYAEKLTWDDEVIRLISKPFPIQMVQEILGVENCFVTEMLNKDTTTKGLHEEEHRIIDAILSPYSPQEKGVLIARLQSIFDITLQRLRRLAIDEYRSRGDMGILGVLKSAKLHEISFEI